MSEERETSVSTEPSISSDADTAGALDELEEEMEGTRRAGLADRYHSARQRVKEQNRTESSDTARSGLAGVWDRLRNPADVLDERCSITGVETVPKLDSKEWLDPSPEREQVDAIRFELDHEKYTEWYSWEPEEPNHELTKIIEFYGDGEFNQLFAEDVEVVVSDSHWTVIVTPTPFYRRTAHLKHQFRQAVRTVDAIMGNEEKTPLVNWEGKSSLEELTGSEEESLFTATDYLIPAPSSRASLWVDAGAAFLIGLGIFGLLISAKIGTVWGAALSILVGIIGCGVILKFCVYGPRYYKGEFQHMWFGLKAAVMVVLPPLAVAVWAWKRAIAGLRSINELQPYP